MAIETDLRRIRGLVSAAPLQRVYMSDPSRWKTLCDGLDNITDQRHRVDREDALDVVRGMVGLDPLSRGGDDSESTLVAGVSAVRAELEDQLNELRRRFADAPLSALLDGSQYLVEKVQALAAGSGSAFDRVAGNELLTKLRQIRTGLEERHVDHDEHLHDVDNAIFTVGAALAESGGPEVRLLTEYGLTVMLRYVDELLREVDGSFAEDAGGWPG